MRRDLPSGIVTFLFTDVEGSTRLLHELGAEAYADALAKHRRVIREACAAHSGVEVDTQGDAFFFAFPTAPGALAAAGQFTEALATGPIQVRVGLHTGTPLVTDEGYVGEDVHFAARVAAAAHGGQVVLSAATAKTGLSGSEPQALPVRELGEHRLKDIGEAVAIFQLGEGSFPPLKTISNTNLPRPASSFVGREAEVEAVLSRIAGGARLATLTGPGGSGKTRLAIEAASTLVPEYKAGVFWVGLAALRDPALVTETIAQTLGAKDGLAEHIAERELLLLLDNFEQVIEAAPELASLVERCPNLTMLVTSRELLRVRGEVEYPVPPLAEPEAVSLFCERSQLAPSEEIAELCARLDLLPLAVELAAARTKALSPAQILGRLSQRLDLLKGGRDADPRQQTLRATIEWSYDLLTGEEQELFRNVSIFAGGCTLEAAEQVVGADLDTLHSLVDKSLLRFTDERYWMLETIREYAAARLATSPSEERVLGRRAWHYLELSDRVDVGSRLLGRELENFRSSLIHARHAGQQELELRLAVALSRSYQDLNRPVDARPYLEDALAAVPDGRLDLRAQALEALGYCLLYADELVAAQAAGEACLDAYRQLSDQAGVAAALNQLGLVVFERGDHARGRALLVESAEVSRARGESAAGTENNLGVMALEDGDYIAAAIWFERSLEAHERLGMGRPATLVSNLGLAALLRGEASEAVPLYRESLVIAAERDAPHAISRALEGYGSAVILSGREVTSGVHVLGAARRARRELGSTPNKTERSAHGAAAERARDLLGSDRLEELMAAGELLSPDEAVALALSLD